MIEIIDPQQISRDGEALLALNDAGITRLAPAADFGWNHAVDQTWMLRQLERFIEGKARDQLVLVDGAVGKSGFHAFLERRLGVRIAGVEPPGQNRRPGSLPDVDHLEDFLELDAYADGSVDVVLWMAGIVRNEREVMRRLYQKSMRMLKPGGLFLATIALAETSGWFKPAEQTNLDLPAALDVFDQMSARGGFDAVKANYRQNFLLLRDKFMECYGHFTPTDPPFITAGVSQVKDAPAATAPAYVFMPDTPGQARWMAGLARAAENGRVLLPASRYREISRGLDEAGLEYTIYHPGVLERLDPAVIVLGNDWDDEPRRIILEARALGVDTVVIQEGPLDLEDRKLNALRNAGHALLLSEGARTWLPEGRVSGCPRFDRLEPLPLPPAPRALVVDSFNGGVYEPSHDAWLRAVTQACIALGLEYHVAGADEQAELPRLIEQSSVVVGRAGVTLLEAAAQGRAVVCYNPFGEPVTFFEPEGSRPVTARDKDGLSACLKAAMSAVPQRAFLEANIGPLDGRAGFRCLSALDAVAFAWLMKRAQAGVPSGRLNEAAAALINALHIAPDDSAALVLLGECLLALGRTAGAAAMAAHALWVNPSDGGARALAEKAGPLPRVDAPLVSVIVPTRDRPQMLEAALRSILCQTMQDFEIIVVNDAGQDVRALVEALDPAGRIRYLRLEQPVGPSCRNAALRAARGKYIAYLDDDDLFYLDHLETLANHLEASGESVAYTNEARIWQEKGADGRYVTVDRDRPYAFDFDYDWILDSNFLSLRCVMHRRDLLDTVGLFDERLYALEDMDLWIRMSRRWRFTHLPQVTAAWSWRPDGSSLSSRKQTFDRGLELIYAKYPLERRERDQRRRARELAGRLAMSIENEEVLKLKLERSEWLLTQARPQHPAIKLLRRSAEVLRKEGLMPAIRAAIRRVLRWTGIKKAPLTVDRVRNAVRIDPPAAGAIEVSSSDMIIFPVIDWEFRVQRPQHLALQLARRGHRVFYLRTAFEPGTAPRVEQIGANIFNVTLNGPKEANIYTERMSAPLEEKSRQGLAWLREQFDIASAVMMVDLPYWTDLVISLRERYGWKLVYDCMDRHSGFSTNTSAMLDLEQRLSRAADLVLATSHPICAEQQGLNSNVMLAPNAGDFAHFNPAAGDLPVPADISALKKPLIGYYGAISDWYDTALVAALAHRRADWSFILIGDRAGANLAPLQGLANVTLLDEKPYGDLPAYLHAFDACMIPFKKTPLTDATNPVKLFEYLSAGKPVVSSRLEEIGHYGEWVRLAGGLDEWEAALEAALAERDAGAAARRVEFARRNTWEARAAEIDAALAALFPKVSVLVITYNNLEINQICLDSIYRNSQYPNYEVVVVDNASSDGTPAFLREFAAKHDNLVLALNSDNKGFAGGNNQAAGLAGGDVLVFLNNDTVTPPGWMGKLLRHLNDAKVGMLGPVTNWAGNEARIDVPYSTIDEMVGFAREYTRLHDGQVFEIPMLAFFCVAIRKALWDEIGGLDERFGLGMFEDDDYAYRVRQKGLRILCVEDAFVHHWGSASFSKIDNERYQRLFDENRAKFEAKWGVTWALHKDRLAKE